MVGISITLGALFSVPVAFGRMSSNRILSSLAYGYVYFFRGTPLIAQLVPDLLWLRLLPRRA
jgi:polar amino acid transport system permease protein